MLKAYWKVDVKAVKGRGYEPCEASNVYTFNP